MEQVAVVAGDYREFQNFIVKNKLPSSSFFYVSGVEKLLGKRKIPYVLYGTCYKRKDYISIRDRLTSNECFPMEHKE